MAADGAQPQEVGIALRRIFADALEHQEVGFP
jgi:hypothetical protein